MVDYAVNPGGVFWLGVNTNSNLNSDEYELDPFKLENIVPPEGIPIVRTRKFRGDQAIPYENSWMDYVKNRHVVFNIANGTSVIINLTTYEGLFRNSSNILTNVVHISSDNYHIKVAMSYNTAKTITMNRDVANPKGFVTFDGLSYSNGRIVSSYFT